MNPEVKYSDVIILGGGPAGSSCALALAGTGLRVTVLDKSEFPRDKVCGDAIGGRALRIARELSPALAAELEQWPLKQKAAGWMLRAPSGRTVEAYFTHPGYISARYDFDHRLLQEALQVPEVSFNGGQSVSEVEITDEGCSVTAGDRLYRAKVIVACDGAHSVAARRLFERTVDPDFHSGAVRAYYRNVEGTTGSELLEIHLIKGYLPGYFWIFPLPDGRSNVGFGMLTRDIRDRKIDLKKAFHEILQQDHLKKRFENAVAESPVEGFGLPLGGRALPVVGTRVLLCGDAASLIDPLNGEGIGNAMLSGKLAGEWVRNAFAAGDFSETFLRGYQNALYAKLLPELKSKLRMQKLFNRPWLIDVLVWLGSRSRVLREAIARKL